MKLHFVCSLQLTVKPNCTILGMYINFTISSILLLTFLLISAALHLVLFHTGACLFCFDGKYIAFFNCRVLKSLYRDFFYMFFLLLMSIYIFLMSVIPLVISSLNRVLDPSGMLDFSCLKSFLIFPRQSIASETDS